MQLKMHTVLILVFSCSRLGQLSRLAGSLLKPRTHTQDSGLIAVDSTCKECIHTPTCSPPKFSARNELHVLLVALYSSYERWKSMCREPDQYIPAGVPRILLSESDFHNQDRRDGGKHSSATRCDSS